MWREREREIESATPALPRTPHPTRPRTQPRRASGPYPRSDEAVRMAVMCCFNKKRKSANKTCVLFKERTQTEKQRN